MHCIENNKLNNCKIIPNESLEFVTDCLPLPIPQMTFVVRA